MRIVWYVEDNTKTFSYWYSIKLIKTRNTKRLSD